MPYEIIIRKREEVQKKVTRGWTVIAKTNGEEQYGYPPEREETVTQETEVLKQNVEELDLAAVIKAINKL